MMIAASPWALALVSLCLGALLGVLQLLGLRGDVRGYLQTGPRARTVGRHLLRMILLVAAFAALVPLGTPALLGALVGWTLARALWLIGSRSRA